MMEAGRSFQSVIAFATNDWLNETVLPEMRLTVRVLLRRDDILSGGENREAFRLGQ